MRKSKSTAVTVAVKGATITEDVIAEAINRRFEEVRQTANALRMQMLGVGFTLVQAERELEKLGKLKKGRFDQGTSLGSWLAAHCPSLPYKTAMDWKILAEKSLKKIGGDEGEALDLMLADGDEACKGESAGRWTEAQMSAREDIYACETKGELKQMLMPFMGSGKAGRPVGSVQKGRATDTNDPETCARAEWSRVIVPATNTVVLESAAKLLSRKDVEDALTALKTLIDFLNARKSELR